MRRILKKYRFIILSVFLVMGMSIAVRPFAFYIDSKAKRAEAHKELKNDNQVVNALPSARDHTNIVLVLLCTGLVGFFGVRRHRKTLENYSKIKPPEMQNPRRFLKRK